MDVEKLKKYYPLAISGVILLAIAVFLYFYGNFLYGIVEEQFLENKPVSTLFPVIFKTAALIAGTQIFLVISRFAITKYLELNHKKKELKVILKLFTYLVWAIVAIIIIMGFFEDIGALLTSIGLIGFGITFALQKPIMNFVGWLLIIFTGPFGVGDRIEVNDIRGDVISIHTMYIRVQGTKTGGHQEKSEKIITIPNEFVLANPVINYSKLGDLFTDDLSIGITYESNWGKAVEIVEKVALNTIKKYRVNMPATKAERKSWQEAVKLLQEASKKIKNGLAKESVKENIDLLKSNTEAKAEVDTPKPSILLSLEDSSININVIYQTDLRSARVTRHEIVKGMLEEFEKTKDIDFAYPHMEIVASDKTKGVRKFDKSLLAFLDEKGQ